MFGHTLVKRGSSIYNLSNLHKVFIVRLCKLGMSKQAYDKRIRLESALSLVETGKVARSNHVDVFTVQGLTDLYYVNITDETCHDSHGQQCKDLRYNCDPTLGQVCKHILGARLVSGHIKTISEALV